MSLVFEMAIKEAVKEQLKHFLYNDAEVSGMGHMTGMTPAKRRTHKMTWVDFSDEELKIVNEVERNPGMKGDQIIKFMSVHNPTGTGVTCEAAVTKGLLSNLVKRKVLISNEGYPLNDSSPPPPCKLPTLLPE